MPRRRISEGPGQFLERTPGLPARAARGRVRAAFMPAICGVVQRRAGMGTSEESYRLYSCRSCAQQVHICRHCDRGNQYCAGKCAQIRRRESLRRAGERYQLSYRGACQHAARQSAWRRRQAQKVTHQGSLVSPVPVIVAANAIQSTTEGADADITTLEQPPLPYRAPAAHCCSFCGRALSAFARIGWLRGGP